MGGSWHLEDNVVGAWAQACSRTLLTNKPTLEAVWPGAKGFPTNCVLCKRRKASQERVRTTFIQDKRGWLRGRDSVSVRDLGYVGPAQRDRQCRWPGKGLESVQLLARVQAQGLQTAPGHGGYVCPKPHTVPVQVLWCTSIPQHFWH